MSISSINYALFEALSVVFHVSTLKHESVISKRHMYMASCFVDSNLAYYFLCYFLHTGSSFIVLNCFDILVTIVHNLLVG